MTGAIARILLRYVVGMGIAGSAVIGDQLATDPDIVMAVSAVIGLGVEWAYVIAKRRGWAT
jgi:preprotein translocase subunit Sec61beta